jgi:CubicO group peptidase (beta-lactamase class C family)
MSIAVVHGTDTLVMRGYGYADLEFEVPTPARTIYEIGSVTKQFTAAAILQLVEQDKVDLDADVTEYLPDYPTSHYYVPVRRLLDHTSGIKGYTELSEFAEMQVRDLPKDSVVALFSRHPFDFLPGEAMIYNNSAYFLLGVIIERVSGQSYAEYLREHLFEPTGMLDSHYCSERVVMKRKAHGYEADSTGLIHKGFLRHVYPYAAGSLCSTVGDLVAWNRALHGRQILGERAYRTMITPEPLNDGTRLRYAKGVAVNQINGHECIHHGGGIDGFLSELQYYPEHDLSIVVLINTVGPTNPGRIAREIARLVLGEGEGGVRALTFKGDLDQFTGRFVGPARGSNLELTVARDDEGLVASRGRGDPDQLDYVGGTTFADSDGVMLFTFVRDNGFIAELRVDTVSGLYVLRRQAR